MLFVEAIAIIGVNVFVFITGWFSASIKYKSIVNLLYICLFYAIIRIVVGCFTGHFNPKDILFLSSSNWFIPSYIGLLLLTPWLNALPFNKKTGGGCPRTQFEKNSSSKMAGKTINSENNHVDVMNKDAEICLNSDTLLPGNSVGGVFGQPGGGILLLLIFDWWFGYFPCQVAVEPGFGWGYSVLSFSLIYLIARYYRENGIPKIVRNNSVAIYVICSVLIAVEGYCLLYALEGRGKHMVTLLNRLVYSYNNPLVMLSSLAFFSFFEKNQIKDSKVINYLAQSCLAILLIHSSSSLNTPMINFFNYILNQYNGVIIVILWIAGLIAIFTISVLIDQIRIYSYKIIAPTLMELYKRFENRY